MSDLGFRLQGSKAYLVRAGNEREIPRESLLEIYQLVLGHISPVRDYSNVTSIRKLLRIIDLECEPDESEESDDESEKADDESEEVIPAPKPATKQRPARNRRPGPRTVRRTATKTEKEACSEASSEASDSDE